MLEPFAVASAIVAVGDELLNGFVVDTNSNWLAERLRRLGHPLKRITTVRDREPEIADQVRRDIADPEIETLFCCGGLGPTPDDRTLAALALALDRPLVVEEQVRARIEKRVRRMHEEGLVASAELSEGNLRMTRVPAGPDVVFKNRRGMAPGLMYRVDGTRLFVLPGVPRELKSLFTEEIEPAHLAGGRGSAVSELRFRFALESRFYPLLRELEETYPEVSVGSYPDFESKELTIRIVGQDPGQVETVTGIVRRRVAAEALAEP